MATTATVTAAAAAATLLLLLCLCPPSAEAYPRSLICREARRAHRRVDPDFDASRCTYGWVVDECGVKKCAKGPGRICGGKHQAYGFCGEGLMCNNCNRCDGCSLKTFECFEDRNCNYFLK